MIIDYKNVDIYQEENLILKGVNFKLKKNEFVFITGKVGSGKTSFLKSLYAAIPVKGEKAEVLDYDIIHLKAKKTPGLRMQLGIVFQNFQLLPDRTVFGNLEFVLKATGWKKKNEIKNRIEEVLQIVHLKEKVNNFPHELSGGEQQRTSIARAILNNPRIIIADEPTGNLDSDASNQLIDILKGICTNGSTIIMSTHNTNLLPLVPNAFIYKCENNEFIKISGNKNSDTEQEIFSSDMQVDKENTSKSSPKEEIKGLLQKENVKKTEGIITSSSIEKEKTPDFSTNETPNS